MSNKPINNKCFVDWTDLSAHSSFDSDFQHNEFIEYKHKIEKNSIVEKSVSFMAQFLREH